MKLFRKIYQLYKIHLADLLFVAIIITLIFLGQKIPYVNLLIGSVDPFITAVFVTWLFLLFILSPSVQKMMRFLILLLILGIGITFLNNRIIEDLYGSLIYSVLATAVIIEIRKLRKSLKNEPLQQ